MSAILSYVLARLGEASTWRGLILLATSLGIHLTDAQSSHIIEAGLALAGLVGVVLPDASAKPAA